jgi:hypothetical protein
MSAQHDLDRQLNAFLVDGPTSLPDASFDAVRDRTEQTRQRVVLGPWRVPTVSKLVPIGLGAAAVIASSSLVPDSSVRTARMWADRPPSASPDAARRPSRRASGRTPRRGPVTRHSIRCALADTPQITVTIPSGMDVHYRVRSITKGDRRDPPKPRCWLLGHAGRYGLHVYGIPATGHRPRRQPRHHGR